MTRLYAVLLGLVAVMISACSSLQAHQNLPLQPQAQGPAYRITTIPDETSPELFVALAFSGGGKRSSAFGYGVLSGLREIMIDYGGGARPMTAEIDVVTGVSGGSFTAAAFALRREELFSSYVDGFLKYDLNAEIFGIYLLPWHWDWAFNPAWGSNDEMARVYDDLLFQGKTYSDLAKLGRPFLGVQATDFANEAPFIFSQETFDWLCSDVSSVPIARAVAASNGFPILFSPISLRNYSGNQPASCVRPHWVDEYANIDDELSRRRHLAKVAQNYMHKRESSYVHLLDGGVADNLALRGLVQLMAPATENSEGEVERLKRVRHVLIVSVDGQAEPDRQLTEVPYLDSIFRILGAVTSTAIDRYGFETLIHAREMTERLADGIARRDCPLASSGKPLPCRSVTPHFAHVSLGDLADGEARARLASIPTGLTISDENVDALVAAGRDAVLCDPAMRRFFEAQPGVVMPPPPATCRLRAAPGA